MNSLFSGPQLSYLVIAVLVLALAFAGIVWVGRMIRGELGPGAARGADPAGLAMLGQIPPAMMKEAIARGLVVPAQLAGMSEMERTFLFASLKQKLAAAATGAAAAPAADAAEAAPQAASVPAVAPKPAAAAIPAALPPAMASLLDADKLRLWCPMCGTELSLPVFPPLLARCATCGMKSAVRADEGGRYVVNVSPPPKIS
jgi:hypothetical protein